MFFISFWRRNILCNALVRYRVHFLFLLSFHSQAEIRRRWIWTNKKRPRLKNIVEVMEQNTCAHMVEISFRSSSSGESCYFVRFFSFCLEFKFPFNFFRWIFFNISLDFFLSIVARTLLLFQCLFLFLFD